MGEFLNLVSPDQALKEVFNQLDSRLGTELVEITDSLNRVVAEDVQSLENLPSFVRSTMDGYSVRASDTFGASESLPALLNVIGEISMGESTKIQIGIGEAVKAYTGGMLAECADAVVMVERTNVVDKQLIEVTRPVAAGENVLQVGEDIRPEEVILKCGQKIRPQDIGGLAALGITHIEVIRKPKVAIVSTGDELVELGFELPLGKIRDINTYTISSMIIEAGGIPISYGPLGDNFEEQLQVAQSAVQSCDLVIFSAGSSTSSRDMTARVFSSLGDPGVLVHGISIKPGKPAIIALADGKPAFGLPGNPVSAMVVFDLLVKPVIKKSLGLGEDLFSTVNARITQNIPSVSGREDFIPVKLYSENQKFYATPVFGKSNLIFTLIRANGIIKIPLDSSGIYEGMEVLVKSF